MLNTILIIFLYTALLVSLTWIIIKYTVKVFRFEKRFIDYMINRGPYNMWCKKQTPKKTVGNDLCPKCNSYLCSEPGDTYCFNCGQAIDWEE